MMVRTCFFPALGAAFAVLTAACTEGPGPDVSGPVFGKAGSTTVVLDFLEGSSFDFWSDARLVTGRNNKNRIDIEWSPFVLAARFTDPEDGRALADACHPGVVSTLTDQQGDDLARAILLDPSNRNGVIHAGVNKQLLSAPMDFDFFPWTDTTGIVGNPGQQHTVRLGTAGGATISVLETDSHTLVTSQHGSIVIMPDIDKGVGASLQVVCDGILDFAFTVSK